MKKFTIEEPFWALFPHAKIGVVLCRSIDNRVRDEEQYQALLRSAAEETPKYLPNPEFSSNEVVKVWREAFQKFKTKKGARSSIEALLKRVQSGNPPGSINPLVDIYNATSLRYALPCGGEDIDTFVGDIRLTIAEGTEPFITLGTDENAPPYPGEIVYKDDAGAICRCWNWRESVRTMLTATTQNAFLCVELVDESRSEALAAALQELANQVSTHLGGTSEIYTLDIDHREITIA